ncbi:glycosyltransferase [Candidatus Micrarchaeota archaeon]|nr:glycosyltransferase [Candidatus Micrarchaeota archaeon]
MKKLSKQQADRTIVLLPTLNEEDGLPWVLEKLKLVGAKRIILIDGNSTDATHAIAKKAGCEIILQEGKGKGRGFVSFLKKHKIEEDKFYVMLDADATYDPLQLPEFVDKLEEGFDVVTGNRQQKINSFRDVYHVIGAKGISVFGAIVYQKWNPDICTGYWGFTGKALKKMVIDAQRFDLEAALFSEACKKSMKMTVLPIHYYDRAGEAKLHAYDALSIAAKLVEKRF